MNGQIAQQLVVKEHRNGMLFDTEKYFIFDVFQSPEMRQWK